MIKINIIAIPTTIIAADNILIIITVISVLIITNTFK